jgi:hypothetical protein
VEVVILSYQVSWSRELPGSVYHDVPSLEAQDFEFDVDLEDPNGPSFADDSASVVVVTSQAEVEYHLVHRSEVVLERGQRQY